MRTINNYVCLKPKIDPNTMRLEGGKIIYIDTSFEPEKHSTVVCEVIAVPEMLIFDENHPETMDWETDMEVRVGDTVIIHYMGYQSAFSAENRTIEVGDETYFFCSYKYIYLAKRRWRKADEELFWNVNNAKTISDQELAENNMVIEGSEIYNVIMCNGYVLAQPTEKQYKSDVLYIPKSLENTNKKWVKICYVGKPNRRYLQEIYADSDVKSGDIVVIDASSDVPLEYNPTFNGKQLYWRISRALLQAVKE